MDPNSQNQRWSLWTFIVYEVGRHVPKKDVESNMARWITKLWGSAAKLRVSKVQNNWEIEVVVEGPTANDKNAVCFVAREFDSFVHKGWSYGGFGNVMVRVLAGEDVQGRPRDQWIDMPTIPR